MTKYIIYRMDVRGFIISYWNDILQKWQYGLTDECKVNSCNYAAIKARHLDEDLPDRMSVGVMGV